MASWILLLPILAAALHATWNALVKTAADRLTTLAAIALVTSTIGLSMLPFVDSPSRASWGLIGVSVLLEYAYYGFVFFAYRAGDLSLVYPLARGTAPLLVATGAAVFANELLSLPALLGVLIACVGISSLAVGHLGKLSDPLPLALAIGTGLIIAGYSISNGIGVRLADSPFGFIAWLFVLEFPVVLFAAFRRRHVLLDTVTSNWRCGLMAGLCAAVAYGLVIYAAAFAPLSVVSALRETSVVMAALIGTVLMGERPWQDRIVAATLVAGGVALMTIFH